MLVLNKFGSINFWKTPEGIVMPVSSMIQGKLRGGGFPTGPVHGLPPSDPLWKDVALPQHGWLRHPAKYFQNSNTDPHNRRKSYNFDFPAVKEYPWEFSATISVKEISPESEGTCRSALTYGTEIRRSSLCTNNRPMPFSMGFHPYFTLLGGEFELLINDKLVLKKSGLHLDTPHFFSLSERSNLVVLKTGNRIIIIHTSEADEIVVWTDNYGYLCVEPVYGRRKAQALERGERHEVLCGIQVAQN